MVCGASLCDVNGLAAAFGCVVFGMNWPSALQQLSLASY